MVVILVEGLNVLALVVCLVLLVVGAGVIGSKLSTSELDPYSALIALTSSSGSSKSSGYDLKMNESLNKAFRHVGTLFVQGSGPTYKPIKSSMRQITESATIANQSNMGSQSIR